MLIKQPLTAMRKKINFVSNPFEIHGHNNKRSIRSSMISDHFWKFFNIAQNQNPIHFRGQHFCFLRQKEDEFLESEGNLKEH